MRIPKFIKQLFTSPPPKGPTEADNLNLEYLLKQIGAGLIIVIGTEHTAIDKVVDLIAEDKGGWVITPTNNQEVPCKVTDDLAEVLVNKMFTLKIPSTVPVLAKTKNIASQIGKESFSEHSATTTILGTLEDGNGMSCFLRASSRYLLQVRATDSNYIIINLLRSRTGSVCEAKLFLEEA